MPTAALPLIDKLSEDMPDLLRPIKVQKRCASVDSILQGKTVSVTVPVYCCGDGRLPRFFIAYYRNGQRVRQSFSTIDKAKQEAQVAARQIAAGLAKATGLATMPSSLLFLISQQHITPAIYALAHDCGIMLDSVIENLAAPNPGFPNRLALAKTHPSNRSGRKDDCCQRQVAPVSYVHHLESRLHWHAQYVSGRALTTRKRRKGDMRCRAKDGL